MIAYVEKMRASDLLRPAPEGLYCPPGDFFIDPVRPVARALITHGHSDHARPGHGAVLATRQTLDIMALRCGADFAGTREAARLGETKRIGGVKATFHPAGHVLGSAQIAVEHGGTRIVVSGDYKRSPDPTCEAFEPVGCDVFITESTFGLPIYRWCPDEEVFADIGTWWARNVDHGRASVLACYSFGKAQRVLSGIDPSIGPIVVHGAVEPLNRAYRAAGVALPDTLRVTDVKDRADLRRCLVICPPSAVGSPWLRRFGDAQTAFASGWMQVRGNRRRGGYDRGFVLSDHADWPGLHQAIEATGASRVIVTHGSAAAMVRHLRERGLQAEAFATEYGEDVVEADLQAGEEGCLDG